MGIVIATIICLKICVSKMTTVYLREDEWISFYVNNPDYEIITNKEGVQTAIKVR